MGPRNFFGRMAELVKAPVLKTGSPFGLGGSSPSLIVRIIILGNQIEIL